MGLRGGPPREHALATPFGTLEQCRGRALLDLTSAGRKHFGHPDPAKREKDLLFAKDSESSMFFLPSNQRTSLGKDNCRISNQPATALRHHSQMVPGEGCFSPAVSGPPFLRAVTSPAPAPLVRSWTPFCFAPPSQPSDTSASFPASSDQSP